MLKRIAIENFQIHKRLELDFDKYVTTIVGPSDTGKSAILRALMWVLTNRPSGDEFIREGSSHVSVELEVDGHIITRKRSKSVNLYTLDDVEFKAFGVDPPAEVLKVLNLSGINFQTQYDAPFWFKETPGEVSRQLNQIVNLSIIDSTLANLDKARREALTQVKLLEQEVKDAAEARSSVSWARTAAEDLTEVEEFHKQYVEASGNHQRLSEILGSVYRYGQALENAGALAALSKKTVDAGESWSSILEKRDHLHRLLMDLRAQQEVVSRPIPDVTNLLQLKAVWDGARGRTQTLYDRISNATEAQTDVKRASTKAAEFHAEFKQQLGKVCPLCGSKL